MRWEHLVPSDFERLVQETELCIVPTGSLERHGEHIPFGCDAIIAHTMATMAAEQEPAVVFPPWFMMQVHEAATFTGTVNYPASFAIEAFKHLLDSIADNGFKKILVVNAHGGNSHMLDYVSMANMDRPARYTFYQTSILNTAPMTEAERETLSKLWESDMSGGHADERETSLFMACRPGLVRLDLCGDTSISANPRFEHLTSQGIRTPQWWYAAYPENVTGLPKVASEEKGQRALELYVRALTRVIRTVKEDTVAPRLQQAFLDGVEKKGH